MDKDKVKKLLTLALNDAASVGEIENAGRLLIRHLRSTNTRAEEVLNNSSGKAKEKVVFVEKIIYQDRIVYKDKIVFVKPDANTQGTNNKKANTPDPVFPFGKYKWKPIKEAPVDYLNWLLNNYDNMEDSIRIYICNHLGIPYFKPQKKI